MVAQVARHWTVVAGIDDAATLAAAHWSVQAGDAALASAAAKKPSPGTKVPPPCGLVPQRARDTLVRLGNALYSCGRGIEAEDRFREAFQLANALNDDQLVARAALGLCKAFATAKSTANE